MEMIGTEVGEDVVSVMTGVVLSSGEPNVALQFPETQIPTTAVVVSTATIARTVVTMHLFLFLAARASARSRLILSSSNRRL